MQYLLLINWPYGQDGQDASTHNLFFLSPEVVGFNPIFT